MFDKVIGYQDEKLELSRVLDTILNESKYAKIGVKTPRNILLYGEAGIGKSLLAGEFAKATEKKIYVIRKDQPNGDFIKYFITCLDNLEIDALGLLGDSRCFGCFSTYQRAKEALEINECDMCALGLEDKAIFILG